MADKTLNDAAVGKFGPYGGQFVPETLMPALDELEKAHEHARTDKEFNSELDHLLTTYVGRPTPLTYAGRLSGYLGGAQIYLKREDLRPRLHLQQARAQTFVGRRDRPAPL